MLVEEKLKRTKVAEILKGDQKEIVNKTISVKGWVRGFRNDRFVQLNDGSTIKTLQAVVDAENFDEAILKKITTGAAVGLKGILVESQGAGQAVELRVSEIEIIGEANPVDIQKTVMQPKKHSLDYLREQAHLRLRTNTFGAIFRIRHALSFAIHKYFNDKGFYYMHTPIITGSDAEGAGEMFRVTTLDLKNPPKNPDGSIDFKQDFFGKETNLTVSGQLEGELAAMALGQIYTFGPTFRAENSNTTRHLAEFWMIEPEVAFADLDDNMNLAEDFLKYVIKYAIDNCPDDLAFLAQRYADEEKGKKKEEQSEMGLLDKLKFVVENDFVRITYTEAIDILKNSNYNKKKKFQYLIEGWGADLQSEHERYLVEKHFKKPVILSDYPKAIKAFYMRENEDGKTVRAMDILFPGIGEIVGGSQREERYEKLAQRVKEVGIHEQDIWWYMETRKFGTAPHAGFGLGFERLMLFLTGLGNIRDVIPFPRTPKNAEF